MPNTTGAERMSLTQAPQTRIAIVSDTDMHGGLSLAASWLALRRAGMEPMVAYSNFQPVRPGERPTVPVTTANFLAEALPQVIAPGFGGTLYILDIPINRVAPQQHIQALHQYVIVGDRVVVVNKGEHETVPNAARLYRQAGVEFIPTDTDTGVALYIPRAVADVMDNDIYRIAKWAALADFDTSIENQVSYEEEWLVTEVIDAYWKQHAARDEAIPAEYRARHGNVGAVARMVVENGLEWLERRARELAGTGIPLPRYRVIGDVAVVEEEAPAGLAWKQAAKVGREARVKVVISRAQSPRGIAVIVAAYWRWMARLPQLARIVDEVVQEVAAGRSVVGNPGARSILARSPEDAKLLVQELARRLNERIEREAYTPRTARFINERDVAIAIHEDFRAILERLTEILEEQKKMYQEYLKLKQKQVELLERTQRHEYD